MEVEGGGGSEMGGGREEDLRLWRRSTLDRRSWKR
jgi:hypothetical protein